MIGFLVNTLPIRFDFLNNNISFLQLLQQLHIGMLAVIENQDVPFQNIVSDLKLSSDPFRNPLYRVGFNFQENQLYEFDIPHVEVTALPAEAIGSKMELHLGIIQKGGNLIGTFEYNTDLFNVSTIERLQMHFLNLVNYLLIDFKGNLPINIAPIMSDEEVHLISEIWNETSAEYPKKPIYDLFLEQVHRTPKATALIIESIR